MIAIIKYNAGNAFNVQQALNRLSIPSIITDEPGVIKNASHVIFPGVGHAKPAMAYLHNTQLDTLIPTLNQPVLGICLGMQLLCSYSEEGNTRCMGVFENKVLPFSSATLKVPQIGWNRLGGLSSPLLHGVKEGAYVYFVHGYYAALTKDTAATSDYIHPFSAALQKDNFFGVQFHPEKSGDVGEKILKNFIELK